MLGMVAMPPPAGSEVGPVQGPPVAAPVAAPAPAEPRPAAAAPPAKARARTMMGMSPIVPPAGHGASGPAPIPEAPPGQAPPLEAAPPEGPSASFESGAIDESDPHQAATASFAAPRVPATTNRTMLGMPQADLEAVQAAQAAAADAAPAPAAEAGAQGKRADPLGPTNRTMLGMVATPRPDGAPRSNYPGPPAAPAAGPPRQRTHRQYTDSNSLPPPAPRRKGNKLVIIAGVMLVALLLVVGGGLGIYLLMSGDSTAVRASVVPTEAGDGLRVEFADAPEGARVRFGGQELVLEDGASVFPLASDTLTVGDNELTVELIDGDGQQEAHTVTLTVSYRVRADLSALAANPPGLAIVVDALPGSEITVGDEAVTLDDEGRGRRLYPIDGPADEAVLEHEAEYRVTLPDGQVHVGSVETRVPFATLQLDRPGIDVVTDAESIEVAGAVHTGGSVTIAGAEVEQVEGRFVFALALPEVGEREVRVVARQPGHAPRTIAIQIRRVQDMEAEAASFTAEPGLDYARLAQNPTIYRGKQVVLEGRVYNVDVSNGRSFLQILVRGCSRGRRCPLWVTYSQATDATVHDWIRVLGTVTGEQQFRSESDRVITVPRVDARFVLPARADR
ncbi:MAG: hypothetical protein JRH11_01190 [Deltaproteobacteria bacterium]|nr:hypothetical protein [Deltaproteobacteria bacterium]